MSENNLKEIVEEIIEKTKTDKTEDAFWDKADSLLLQAIASYLMETKPDDEKAEKSIDKIIDMLVNDDKEAMDKHFEELKEKNPNSESAKIYAEFTDCAGNVWKSIYISSSARLANVQDS